MPPTTNQEFDAASVFKGRILDGWRFVVNPWVSGEVLYLFGSSINVLSDTVGPDTLVPFLGVFLEQYLSHV